MFKKLKELLGIVDDSKWGLEIRKKKSNESIKVESELIDIDIPTLKVDTVKFENGNFVYSRNGEPVYGVPADCENDDDDDLDYSMF